MPNWTDEQKKAINTEGCNVIVSAGAGSGKTAVLSARVLRKVKEGVHINNLLLLTFTKAAAKEMKERIKKELIKENLDYEVELIDSSYITTFDSFSLSLVKKYYYALGISSDIKVSDPVLLDILKRNILDDIVDKYYKEHNELFLELFCSYSLKDDKELKDIIIKISDKLDLEYDRKSFLKNYMDIFYSDERINRDINLYVENIEDDFIYLKRLFIELKDELEEKKQEKINDAINGIDTIKGYLEIKEFIDNLSLPRAVGYSETAKNINDDIKSVINELKDMTIYNNLDEVKDELISTYNNSEILVEILSKLDNEYTKLKSDMNLYNFNDIAHLAIKLVKEHEDIREEVRNSFNEILIDEYQDTSDIQEQLISLISDNNVYMVGDIKQSIYRFRNANPYIFKNKYDGYSQESNSGVKIDLNKNFRSRKEVLDNINMMFSSIMDNDIGGANYSEDHLAIFGNLMYDEKNSKQKYDLDIYTYQSDADKKITDTEKEIFIIAQDIKEKIDTNYQVLDKDSGVLRDCDYDDFVILIDTKKDFDLYKKVFEYLNIPLAVYREESINNTDQFLVIHNLLKLILLVCKNDYSTDFKYCYTSVLRSYLFNVSDDIIYEDIKSNKFKQTELVKMASTFKDKIDIMTPTQFYNEVLNLFNYYDKILTTTDIVKKEKCIEYLNNLIMSLEENDYNIEDIIYYLDKVIENKYDISYDGSIEQANSVKIMTIHKSKGLEFPICYFSGLQNKFNIRDLKTRIPISSKYGILIPQINEEFKKTIRNVLYIEEEKKEMVSEKIRLLYVALTRCKEHIIIVCPEVTEYVDYSLVPKMIRKKYMSFMSIIKSLWPRLMDYVEEKEANNYTRDYLKNISTENIKSDDNDKLQVTSIEFSTEIISDAHFSKENNEKIGKEENELLEFGTKVHKILEEIDFNNPNLDNYDISDFIKDKVNKFLELDIIKNNLDSKFYKEYEFIEEKDNTVYRGIIDLMIENDNEIIIIDYKLKNIDSDAYKKQLNGYKEYIKSLTNKNVSTYLFSIMDSRLILVK